MRIIFRKQALFSLKEIRFYLAQRWTRKELETLQDDISRELENVSTGLVKHQEYADGIYFALVGKSTVKMFYTVENDEILVLDFFNVRKDPDSLSF
ncbi:MAG: hypothetical protein L6264_00820 [Weeksellaceae bacterium]|nr:hypothetical protein [Bacteroidota bacterium]MCG2779462.1 hypothetical protein [Weeksellaceae bacterium]